MNDTFDTKVLQKIQQERMRPLSRWYFRTRAWALAALAVVATATSAGACALILFLLTDHDWFAVSYLDEGLPAHILRSIPYFWLAIMLLAAALMYQMIRRAGRGYRYPPRTIIGLSLLASIALGTLAFFAGIGNALDTYLEGAVPFYDAAVISNRDIWIYPEEGLLSGTVASVSKESVDIVDSDDQPWTVLVPADYAASQPALVPGTWIKILGTMTDGSHFSASRILPFQHERK